MRCALKFSFLVAIQLWEQPPFSNELLSFSRHFFPRSGVNYGECGANKISEININFAFLWTRNDVRSVDKSVLLQHTHFAFLCLALEMWTNRIVCIRHNHKYHRIFFISLNWWQKQEPKPFAYLTWTAPASRSIIVYSDANMILDTVDSTRNCLEFIICCLC